MKTHQKEKTLSDLDGSIARQFPISFSIFALARSHRGLAAHWIRETGLFPGQEIILMQLWEQDLQSQYNLGRTLRLDHSTIAKSVRRLEDAGLVTRTRSSEDGRVTLVSLTDEGKALEEKVRKAWNKLEMVTTEELSEHEKKVLQSLSVKIASKLDSILNETIKGE